MQILTPTQRSQPTQGGTVWRFQRPQPTRGGTVWRFQRSQPTRGGAVWRFKRSQPTWGGTVWWFQRSQPTRGGTVWGSNDLSLHEVELSGVPTISAYTRWNCLATTDASKSRSTPILTVRCSFQRVFWLGSVRCG